MSTTHTSTRGVALVRIQNVGLKCAARGSLQIQDAKKSSKIAIWAPLHNFDGLYLRNQGTHRQSEKNLLSSNNSSTCPYNMVNFGPLAAEIGLPVWGTPANFNGFRVLAALLHGIQQWASAKLCGVEQRAPPIFGRAAVTLGIGPHLQFLLLLLVLFMVALQNRADHYILSCGFFLLSSFFVLV